MVMRLTVQIINEHLAPGGEGGGGCRQAGAGRNGVGGGSQGGPGPPGAKRSSIYTVSRMTMCKGPRSGQYMVIEGGRRRLGREGELRGKS